MQKTKINVPLTIQEIQDSRTAWIKRVQDEHSKQMKMEDEKISATTRKK